LAGFGHPANLNGFWVLASLLHRRRSVEVNKTLQVVWPSPGLVRYVFIFGGSCPLMKFASCKIHFASKSCVLLYWQRYCAALKQWPSAKLCGMVQGMELRNFHRRCHLYSTGRPPCWASAHILVLRCCRQSDEKPEDSSPSVPLTHSEAVAPSLSFVSTSTHSSAAIVKTRQAQVYFVLFCHHAL